MKLPEEVILLDSLGDIHPDNTHPILVCASHCSDNGAFAQKLTNCHVKAVFLNNAGIGKNQAGISGLSFYEKANIIACAVDHNTAEIGVACDTWESGIISHTNQLAEDAGIQVGNTVQNAVAKISNRFQPSTAQILTSETMITVPNQNKTNQKKYSRIEINGVQVTVADSITFLDESNAGDIAVCGSHGGVSAGHYAQKLQLKAVFFNDAGIGKNNAGIKSLETLSAAGILACTVDCMSAEIFNGADMLENGVISVCNQLATSKGIKVKMSIKEAVSRL